jgi:hypothetical protein
MSKNSREDQDDSWMDRAYEFSWNWNPAFFIITSAALCYFGASTNNALPAALGGVAFIGYIIASECQKQKSVHTENPASEAKKPWYTCVPPTTWLASASVVCLFIAGISGIFSAAPDATEIVFYYAPNKPLIFLGACVAVISVLTLVNDLTHRD